MDAATPALEQRADGAAAGTLPAKRPRAGACSRLLRTPPPSAAPPLLVISGRATDRERPYFTVMDSEAALSPLANIRRTTARWLQDHFSSTEHVSKHRCSSQAPTPRGADDAIAGGRTTLHAGCVHCLCEPSAPPGAATSTLGEPSAALKRVTRVTDTRPSTATAPTPATKRIPLEISRWDPTPTPPADVDGVLVTDEFLVRTTTTVELVWCLVGVWT